MPTLSASAKATGTRSPLTPRVAGAQTPGTRRGPRSELGGNQDTSTPTPTPIATFLNNNVTPRSGSRRGRVGESANSTPVSTPGGTPAPEGLGGFEKEAAKRGNAQFSPSVANGAKGFGSPAEIQADSKFFFANDAQAGAVNSRVTRPQHPPKAASFVYANGETIPTPPMSSSASAVGSAVGEETVSPKFFHVDGAPDLSTPYLPAPRAGSTVSTSSRMTSPRMRASNVSPNQRPMSPVKMAQKSSPALRSTPTLPSPMTPRPSVAERGKSANGTATARRVSIETTHRPLSHKRSASAESPDARGLSTKRLSNGSQASNSPSTPVGTVLIAAGTVSTPEEIKEEDETLHSPSDLRSPARPSPNPQTIDELAANARRERKVLDLEITNSSLTAINRTLEREMRKQAAELRRYRRLSRTGRLSLATTASLRTTSGASSLFSTDSFPSSLSNVSDLVSVSEDETEEGSEESEDESLLSDSELSPSAREENDAKHRAKDEKRLRVDLTKHQQLLVDSQRLNQSLKRCLGWTDNLISEGQRALEYNVRVSDVELGGRVLVKDDAEGEVEDIGIKEGMEMLHEDTELPDQHMDEGSRTVNGDAIPTWTKMGRDDRDSGIELDTPAPALRYPHR